MRHGRNGRKPKTPTKLSTLVTQMVDEHSGPAVNFAKLAGLTAAQLSRMMNPSASDRPPGVLSCLKLSRASGYSAVLLLMYAGHDEIARVLADITRNHPTEQGTAVQETRGLVTGEELEVIRSLRTLSVNTRHAVIFLIQRAAEQREPADSASLHIAQKVVGS